MPKYEVEMKGLREVRGKLGVSVPLRLKRQIDDALEGGIRDMAENSFNKAPVDTGALQHSIIASIRKEAPLTWVYGSTLPYAQRQEYEHKTRKGYFRRAVWEEAPLIQERLTTIVRMTLK